MKPSNQREQEEEQVESSDIKYGSLIGQLKKLGLSMFNPQNPRKPKSKTWKSNHQFQDQQRKPILIKPNHQTNNTTTPLTANPTTSITKPVISITKPAISITKPVISITKPVISINKPATPPTTKPTTSSTTNPYQGSGNLNSNPIRPIQQTPTKPTTTTKPTYTSNSTPNSTSNRTPNQTPNRTPKHKPTTAIDSDSDPNERCQGTTREGKACSRKPMKQPPTPSKPSPSSPNSITSNLTHKALNQLENLLDLSNHQPQEDPRESELNLPKFCFQHYKLNLNQVGTFLLNGKWIKFEDWMSDELPSQTQILLRNEMIKPITTLDKTQKGYIYCHEMIPQPSSHSNPGPYPRTTLIKVGRSVQPIRRLTQWKTQCPSKQPIIRDVFPLLDSNGTNSYQLGCEKVSENPKRFHHRWERLCLIELNAWSDLQASQRNQLLKKKNEATEVEGNEKCVDCGKIHMELFVLDEGSYERFIKQMILKWQMWCEYAYE